MQLKETELDRRTVYNGLIVNVELHRARLSNGSTVPREVVTHPGGVAIIPVWDNGDVTVVTQFRYPFGREMLEVPAGKRERGEDPLDCARRELSEETGLTAEEWVSLGAVDPSPGFCSERLHLYLARGLRQGEAHPDADELLNVSRVPMEELTKRIMSGEITDGKTIAAVFKAKTRLSASGA